MTKGSSRPQLPEHREDLARRERVLLAANECFTDRGVDQTSVQDVAEHANVSRGTIYRYFSDRDGLVAAAIEFGAREFYREMADAMSEHVTLAKQLGAMAETHARILNDRRTRTMLMRDDADLMHHIVSEGGSAVERIAAFLVPYVSDAQRRGEVGEHVDVAAASDWIARIAHSLTSVGSTGTFELSRPETVRAYVERFAVNGLR